MYPAFIVILNFEHYYLYPKLFFLEYPPSLHFIISKENSKDTFFNTHRVVENKGSILNGKDDDLPRMPEIATTRGHNNSILMNSIS